MMRTSLYLLTILLLATACREPQPTDSDDDATAPLPVVNTEPPATVPAAPPPPDYDTTQWLELIALDSTIRLDIRYATDSNFVGQVLYPCARCFLRPVVARALTDAHQELRVRGLGLKLFDCYRPRDVQWKLWEIVSDPGYVADPRTGSIHNRGGAVDLTIVTADGEELDMGTGFDFFGPRAHHTFTDLPDTILANRRLLKDLMVRHGFAPIRSEWWHYNYQDRSYELADA
ncbi:MAG: M15 family metallopeptidase, partial [Lewinella sp.]|nr:M15 family metallopeptidase [Lewinella sp.]